MANKASEKTPSGRAPFAGREGAREQGGEVPVAPLAPPSQPPPTGNDLRAEARAESVGHQQGANSDALAERTSALERELTRLRVQSAAALGALASAEEQLAAAARRIGEVDEIRRQSMPPPPTELNDARTKAAKVLVELSELRADRDEQKRARDELNAQLDSALAQVAALSSAQRTRDARLALLETAAQANNEKARVEGDRADDAEKQRRVLAEELERARLFGIELKEDRDRLLRGAAASSNDMAATAAELRAAADASVGMRNELIARDAQISSLRREVQDQHNAEAKLRGEMELERSQARARESQLVTEVREREARMIAEVQAREARLVEMAQAREKQLITEAEAAMQALGRDAQPLAERVSMLQKALEQSREREATLDAEARLKSNNNASIASDASEREQQLEEQLEGARRDSRAARDTLHDVQEAKARAEARTGELQGTIDSLGMERAALRAEAGQLRAQVEMMNAVEKRAHQLLQELEELRGENEFLNQEVARYAAADGGKPAPTPPRKRPG